MNNYETIYNEITPEELAKQEGERTKVTENVLKVAREIDPEKKLQGKELVEEVCRYVSTMIPSDELLKESLEHKKIDKWDTTADELLSDRNLIPGHSRKRNINGCTQTSYVTRALLLAKGVSSLSIDTIEESWIKNNKNWNTQQGVGVSGHYFLDVYDEKDKKWYTIGDSKEMFHEQGDYYLNGSRYIETARGRDTADMGFTNEKERLDRLEKSMNNLNTLVSTVIYQGEKLLARDISSVVLTEIATTYPFLNKEEYNKYLEKATKIDSDDPIEEIQELIRFLDNPHANFRKINHSQGKETDEEKLARLPSSELIGDVIYMKIPSLSRITFDNLEKVFTPHLENNVGLILDLRNNKGGDERPAKKFAQKYFIKEEGDYSVGKNIQIAPGGGLEVTSISTYFEGEKRYEKPIIILISNAFSSAERFIAIMKSGSNCTLVGTETAGGSANPIRTIIEHEGERYQLSIPTWRFFLPGKDKPLEETKIQPDIYYDKEDIVDFTIKYVKSKKNEVKI